MSWANDYALETTFDFKFTTRQFSDGVPTTLAGTPVVDIYEDNSLTQITGAETLTVDFDGVTGLNNLRIAATAANGFESGKSYAAVITTGTVGGTSVVGEVVCNFSIERTAALRPTTAGRTLDVTATGAAGIDWANVENPTTVLDLSGTDINLVDTCTANTDMRGTDNAALASVLGALADAAAAGDPTASDTVVAYLKQIINTLEGTAGIPVFPAEAAPANAVSLAEVIRAIHADVTGLNGDAMRGTDSALLASSAPTNFGDLAITVTTGQVTVGTNNDKTGYSISGTKTTLDALNDIAAGDVWAVDATTQQTQGTFGQAIGDPVADTTTIYQAVATDAAGDNVAVDIIAVKAETADILTDTGTSIPATLGTPAADVSADIAAVKAETALIVADTNELQTDWANGGRLDNILDARMAEASINTTAGAVDTVTAVTNRVTANTDQIAGVAAAANQLSLSADTVIGLGTASGTPTTTSMVSDIGVTVDDQYNGRIIIFADDTTTAALRDQATDITGCTAATNTLTFTALTTAPVSGDTFVIV